MKNIPRFWHRAITVIKPTQTMATTEASITMLLEDHCTTLSIHLHLQNHRTGPPCHHESVAARRFHRHPPRSPEKHTGDRRVLFHFTRFLQSSITRPIRHTIRPRHRRRFSLEIRGEVDSFLVAEITEMLSRRDENEARNRQPDQRWGDDTSSSNATNCAGGIIETHRYR